MSIPSSTGAHRIVATFASGCRQRQVRLSYCTVRTLARPSTQAQTAPNEQQRKRARGYTRTVPSRHGKGLAAEKEWQPLFRDDVEEDRAISTKTSGRAASHVKIALSEDKSPSKHSPSDVWKGLMRTVTQPVVIITARQHGVSDDREAHVGATVSSFNSVCMEPYLCVSFNLTRNSQTFRALKETGHLCLTFPQSTEPGLRIADSFASPKKESKLDSSIILLPMSTASLSSSRKPSAVAVAGLDDHHNSGFAFSVLCEYQNSIEVGDHVVVTARVLQDSILTGLPHGWGLDPLYGGDFSPSHLTLTHVHGSYPRIGSSNDPSSPWKLDDLYRGAENLAADLVEKRTWYRKRLEALENAQRHHKGAQKAHHEPTLTELRARDLSSTQIQEYATYYKMRLLLHETLPELRPHTSQESTKGLEMPSPSQKSKARKVGVHGAAEVNMKETEGMNNHDFTQMLQNHLELEKGRQQQKQQKQ